VFAIVYNTGHPKEHQVRSYGTVVTSPLDTSQFHAVAIDHAPGEGEEWDEATESVITSPIPPPTRAEEIRDRDIAGPPPTQTEIFEGIQEILRRLLG